MSTTRARTAATTALRTLSSQASASSLSTAASSSSASRQAESSKLPEPTLRNLVSLYHTSSSFLHDPKDITTGFESAFRRTSSPSFTQFSDWGTSVLSHSKSRPLGGTSNLLSRPLSGSVGGIISDDRGGPIMTIRRVKDQWRQSKESQMWSGSGLDGEERLTERELRVREALYGTWERGAKRGRDAEVGWDGVREYLEVRQKSAGEAAQEWKQLREEMAEMSQTPAEETPGEMDS